jgi:hypothetical protein
MIEGLSLFTSFLIHLTNCEIHFSLFHCASKYYDDCAQILSEHIICSVKPAAHRFFSTLDPLVTTSLNREAGASLALAFRRAQSAEATHPKFEGEKPQERAAQSLRKHKVRDLTGDGVSSDEATAEVSLKSEAATLIEGALPVREFPDNLTPNRHPSASHRLTRLARMIGSAIQSVVASIVIRVHQKGDLTPLLEPTRKN